MSYRIVVTDSGFPSLDPEKGVLKDLGRLELISWSDEAELCEKSALADALLVQWAPINATLISCLRQCKIIVRYGIGVDNIDLKAAAQKGIPVCNVPDYCIEEVSNHTLALALSSLRQVTEVDRYVRNGVWNIVLPRPVLPFHKMNFCLAGFGRIARTVAEKANALGFRVKAYDPYISGAVMEEANVMPVGLAELFAEADILSLHLPLTGTSRHFINDVTLSKMKSSALLVNTSRGGLINMQALVRALSANKLWGAALDVFEEEPLPKSSPLLHCPNLLLSSHVAWYSSNSIPQLQRKAAEEIARGLRGEMLSNPVVPNEINVAIK